MRIFLSLLIAFASSVSFGNTFPSNYPKDLLYQGKPISPTCFYQETNKNSLNIADCGMQDIEIVSTNETMQKKGYIGYEYKSRDDKNGTLPSSYSYYKIIGKYKNNYIISTINNGGGSGTFSSVLLVHRENNNLQINTLPLGGDRCNGGIEEVSQKNHLVTFEVNITAADLLDLTKKNPHHLRPYDDLDACAACCIGTATYQADLTAHNKITLTAVKFNDEIPANDDKKSYQNCFNRLLGKTIKNGQRTFTPVELNKFMDSFNSNCT